MAPHAQTRCRSRGDPFVVDLAIERPLWTRFDPDGDGRPPLPSPPDWSGIFARTRPLRVEIGVGRSDFLIRVAQDEPEFNYLGFEYSYKRVKAFLKQVRRQGAENIRVVAENVHYLFDCLFAPESVDHFFVLFPDPWPKRRHAKHRFVQRRNVDIVASVLRPGGGISLRTDDARYAHQMLAVLEAHPALTNLAGRGQLALGPRHPYATRYQVKWQEEGRSIYFLEFRRRSS